MEKSKSKLNQANAKVVAAKKEAATAFREFYCVGKEVTCQRTATITGVDAEVGVLEVDVDGESDVWSAGWLVG